VLVDVEQGQILTKHDILSRLGKPDTFSEGGSKEESDRTTMTSYRYQLVPGEYLFPGSERADLGAAWHADFLFDERPKHGRRGRLNSVPDDTTPLSVVSFTDNDACVGGYLFPSRERIRSSLPGDGQIEAGEKVRKRE
jgi:hypothetical protein